MKRTLRYSARPEPAPVALSAGSGTVAWLAALSGIAAALIAVLVFPLGGPEAAGLAWLHGVAAPSLGWGAPMRHLVARAWAQDQPVAALIVAGLLFKLVPALGGLLALRLPDVLAAGVVTAGLARLSESLAVGVLAVLVFVASPALWAGVVGPPGLVVDAGAAILLYAVICRYGAGSRTLALGMAAAAIAVLIADGAGVYAIAVIGGIYLHTGLAQRQWRLLGSLRLTLLAALVLAGLTLVDVFGWPEAARGFDLYRRLAVAGQNSGLHVPAWIVAAIMSGATLVSVVRTVIDPRGAAGRVVLVLVLGVLVLWTARVASPLAAVALVPFVALWWAVPLAPRHARAGARWLAVLYVLAGLAAAGALLMLGREVPATNAAFDWACGIGATLWALASLVALWRAWRGASAAPALATACALASVVAAAALWLAAPQQLLVQRDYDQQLARDLAPRMKRPIAVLAPVDAALWRAELGRPVFVARDVSGLCRWAAHHAGRGQPIALVRPHATDPVVARFDNARPLLQSAGTPRTSVMVLDLGAGAGCGQSG